MGFEPRVSNLTPEVMSYTSFVWSGKEGGGKPAVFTCETVNRKHRRRQDEDRRKLGNGFACIEFVVTRCLSENQ